MPHRKNHDQQQHGIGHSSRPATAVPLTVTVVKMLNPASLLSAKPSVASDAWIRLMASTTRHHAAPQTRPSRLAVKGKWAEVCRLSVSGPKGS